MSLTPRAVRLDPMTPAEFDEWLVEAIPSYAAEKAACGQWPADQALDRSAQAHRDLLPDGVSTVGHLLYTVRDADSGAAAGMLWVHYEAGPGCRDAYLYQIQIRQECRGRGLGSAALLALSAELAAAGVRALGLHVFAENTGARRLYERLGFQVTGVHMLKVLGPA